MKNLSIVTLSITALLLSSFSGCDPQTIEPDADIVSADENLGLVYMREEEKLARDVYITLYEIYDNNVFNNISKAEQQHMDKVLTLLETYNIEDPALAEIGVFYNDTLQQLYDDLILLGSESEIAALTIGATIEDLDIRDLDEFSEGLTDPDIINLYNVLNCGSRNHMRAFNFQLNSLGVTYTPQFITQDKFESIINGEHERCGQN